MTRSTYRFRVSIQDSSLPNFILHISAQHNQPPLYLDLLGKIKQYTKAELNDIQNYYMIIEKDGAIAYKFKDDLGLEHAFKYITDQEIIHELKLVRQVNNTSGIVPLVKPIFIRRPSYMETEEEVHFKQQRKDSGISLEQEIREPKKEEEPAKASRKLPALSNIITTQLWSNSNGSCSYTLPSPPQSGTHGSSSSPEASSSFQICNESRIKLPGLSSLILDQNNLYHKKQLAPIYANHHPVLYDQRPLSPPLSTSSPSCPCNYSPTKKSYKATNNKRTRGGTSNQSQFICQHVIDAATGKTCCQAFRRSYDLSRHQTIHLKNRPLCYCHDCGKKFTRLDALRRHERVQGHNNK